MADETLPDTWKLNSYKDQNEPLIHLKYYRVVIKSRGPGISPGYYECGPGYFYGKIEEK